MARGRNGDEEGIARLEPFFGGGWARRTVVPGDSVRRDHVRLPFLADGGREMERPHPRMLAHAGRTVHRYGRRGSRWYNSPQPHIWMTGCGVMAGPVWVSPAVPAVPQLRCTVGQCPPEPGVAINEYGGSIPCLRGPVKRFNQKCWRLKPRLGACGHQVCLRGLPAPQACLSARDDGAANKGRSWGVCCPVDCCEGLEQQVVVHEAFQHDGDTIF